MYCAKCGARNDDSSVFCTQCGCKLVKPSEQDEEVRYTAHSKAGEPASRGGGRIAIAVVAACIVVAAVVVGLFALGVVKLPAPSQSASSAAVSDGASSGVETEEDVSSGASGDQGSTDAGVSGESGHSEQAPLSFKYVNLGTDDAPYVYPVFSGGSNESAVEQLNERLKTAANEAYEQREFTSTSGVSFYYGSWETTVTFLEGDLVGLTHGGYAITGGPHGSPQLWSEVVDLSDGSTTDAWKLVGLSQDERDRQTKQLADDFYSTTGEHDLYTTSEEVFKFSTPQEYVDNNELAYVMTSDGVYVYYGPYLLGSYAFGPRILLMCDREGKYVGYVDANPTDSYPQATDTVTGSNAGSGEGEAQQAPSEEQAEYHIVTDDFEFDIPAYWQGRVDYNVDTNDEGKSRVVVYPISGLTQDPGTAASYRLVTIEAVSSDSPAAMNMGDYIGHIAGKVEAGDKTIVVRSTNWPAERLGFFFNNPTYGGSSQEIELMSALVDLSSGGSVSYGDVVSAAGSVSSMGETVSVYQAVDVDYLNESLMPSLQAR